jgi:hypothetical protein
MRRVAVLLTLGVLVGGCHAKFKKHAPQIEAARTTVHASQGLTVDLGMVNSDDLVGAFINTVQAVKSQKQSKDLQQKLHTEPLLDALEQGVGEALDGGPPFAWTEEDHTELLELEILKWGVAVPSLGDAGVFRLALRVRLYQTDGDRVYNARMSCTEALGSVSVAEEVFGAVNNVRTLEAYSDDDLQALFEGLAARCGDALVLRMRKHAS